MNVERSTAERLLELRRQLGLDQEGLAAQLMVSRSYLSQLENGREPSLKLLELIRRLEAECEHRTVHSVNAVEESQAPYLASGSGGLSDSALEITEQIQTKVRAVVRAADGDASRLGWINEQLAQHLRPPAHWPKPAPRPALDLPPLKSASAHQQPARQRDTACG